MLSYYTKKIAKKALSQNIISECGNTHTRLEKIIQLDEFQEIVIPVQVQESCRLRDRYYLILSYHTTLPYALTICIQEWWQHCSASVVPSRQWTCQTCDTYKSAKKVLARPTGLKGEGYGDWLLDWRWPVFVASSNNTALTSSKLNLQDTMPKQYTLHYKI